MSVLPLPDQSVRLSRAGFKKLYENLRKDPDAAMRCAVEFEKDPKGVLERVFKLTKKQKEAFENTSDDKILHRARLLLTELRSEKPRPLQFHPKRAPKEAVVVVEAGFDGGHCFLLIED